jgi:hypothetical protein
VRARGQAYCQIYCQKRGECVDEHRGFDKIAGSDFGRRARVARRAKARMA